MPAGWAPPHVDGTDSLQGMGADGAIGPLNQPPPPEAAHLAIKDLDTGRTIPFEQADMLWQPLLVRDLDANVLLPFAPVEGRSTSGEEMLNPPPEQLRFMSCSLERSVTPPPLLLPEYKLHKVSRKRKVEMFSACRRVEEPTGSVHFDIRWKDGVLNFTGKLELLPRSPSPHVQELAMYDDFINYYGFPRELGFIRTKLLAETNEASAYTRSSFRASLRWRRRPVPRGRGPRPPMLTMYKAGARASTCSCCADGSPCRESRDGRAAPPRRAWTAHGRAAGLAHTKRTCRRPPLASRLCAPAQRLPDLLRAACARHGRDAQLSGARCSPFHSPAARGLQMPRPQAAEQRRGRHGSQQSRC